MLADFKAFLEWTIEVQTKICVIYSSLFQSWQDKDN